MIVTTLKACQEFSSFCMSNINRSLSSAHVDRLVDDVADLYLLDAYPIVTTAERVIVDGQHRFDMARQLRIPFYFISGDDITIEDVAMANAHTAKYTVEDALAVYTKMGIEPYGRLNETAGDFPKLSVPCLARWGTRNYSSDLFLSGEYVYSRHLYSRMLSERVGDFAKYKSWIWTSKAYKDAIAYLAGVKSYDHKRMKNRLETISPRLVKCGNMREALEIITSIYNFRENSDRRVDLFSAPTQEWAGTEPVTFDKVLLMPNRGVVCSDKVYIHRSDDLSVFAPHPSARPLREVEKLSQAISHKNLLRYYPILVDKDMVVYDGQRRLAAAKKLGVPIYYMILGNISMPMVVRAGGLAMKWTWKNYLASYTNMGLEEYVYATQVLNMYPYLKLESVISSISGRMSTAGHIFKTGKAKFNRALVSDALRIFESLQSDRIRSHGKMQRVVIMILRKYKLADVKDRLIKTLDDVDELVLNNTTESLTKNLLDAYNKGIKVSRYIVLTANSE